jgi:hypothetical protein
VFSRKTILILQEVHTYLKNHGDKSPTDISFSG